MTIRKKRKADTEIRIRIRNKWWRVEVVGHLKCYLIMAGAKGREGLVTHICFQRYLANGNFIPTHTYNGTARLNLDTQYASP